MKLAFKLSSAALLVAASISAAQAGGFMLSEQSVAGQGRAFAGSGIVGDDLSAVWFNPAGMTLLPGTSAQIGATLVSLNLKVKSNDGTQTDNGRDKEMPIPSAYFVHQLSPDMWLGLGITTPYGLSVAYGDDWGANKNNLLNPGGMSERGTYAEIKVFNFNPSLAWKATEKLSFGAGISIEYATAKYRTNTYDGNLKGLIKDGSDFTEEQKQAAAVLSKNIGNAEAGLKADGFAWGFNFGMMWQPTDTVRVGLAYRSNINHKVDGDTDIRFKELTAENLGKYGPGTTEHPGLNILDTTHLSSLNPSALSNVGINMGANGASTVVNGSASMKAPQTVMLTGLWQATPRLRLSGLIRWADWSSFEKLRINVSGKALDALGQMLPAGTSGVNTAGMTIENHWKDTWLFSVGADYDINEQFTVRGGVGYETSAIDDPRYRSPVIPDMNRLMLAAGLTWRPTKNLQGDFAISYLKGLGNNDLYSGTRTGNGMADYEYKDKWGEFTDMHAYMFGAQMVYHF